MHTFKKNNQLRLLYLGSRYYYDVASVKKAEKFLLDCKRLIGNSSLFWVSFQTNCLADTVRSTFDFNTTFKKMKDKLSHEGFHIVGMSSNMRNAKQIAQLRVDRPGSGYKMKQIIPCLPPTTVMGTIPKIIQFDEINLKKHLGPAVYQALHLLSKQNAKNCVILHDNDLNSFVIKKTLMDELEKGVEKEGSEDDFLNKIKTHPDLIYVYPDYLEEPLDQLEFLNNPNYILVTHAKYFVGCEAPNVILCVSSSSPSLSVRCHLMRAVSNLIVIQMIGGGHDLTFNGATVQHAFV